MSNSYLDVVLLFGFGILGYLFKNASYPLVPLVLAIVVGDKAEGAFRQAMLMSMGSLGIFFSSPLVTCLALSCRTSAHDAVATARTIGAAY